MRGFLDIYMGGGRLVLSCASLINVLAIDPASIRNHASNTTDTVITGSGIVLTAKDWSYIVNPPDVDTLFVFNTFVAGQVLVNGGDNYLNIVGITAPRTYTFSTAQQVTRIHAFNQSASAATIIAGPYTKILATDDYFSAFFAQGRWNELAASV